MGNCFKRIPENLEAVYLVFRMFLENICLNVKKMPLSPRIYGLSGNSLSNLIFHHFPVILSALKRFCISVFLTRLVRGILCGCFCDSGEGLGSAGCNLWRDRLPDYRTFRASLFWKMRRIRFASRIRTVHTSFR